MAFEHRNQLWQERDEALGADAIGRLPGDDECVAHGRAVDALARSGERHGQRDGMREQPNGVLAGIAGDSDKLIEDDRLLPWRRALIPRRDACE
jgi:hypothetical protein